MAGHLFNRRGTHGESDVAAYNATVLMALHPGSNATAAPDGASRTALVSICVKVILTSPVYFTSDYLYKIHRVASE